MVSPRHQTSAKVNRLECQPNNYPWGKVGHDSLAAQASLEAAGDGFTIDPSQPYAELWMGTHPKNPAKVWGKGMPLSSHLAQHPELLGDATKFPPPFPIDPKDTSGGEGHVPFLFKILTCKQVLSLQIHPDKALAEKLHKENPDQFPDTNHKPEIAVCLSDNFLGFAAFRPLATIRSFLASTPEVQSLPQAVRDKVNAFVGEGKTGEGEADREELRACWREFIGMEGKETESAVHAFTKRVGQEGADAFEGVGEGLGGDERRNLVQAVRVMEKFNSGDGAIFSTILFLNLVELKRGEGMYVGADGPHAWLQGEIVELMSASDNVLNAGFTPDKDSTRLIADAVTCTPKKPSDLILPSRTFSKGTLGHTVVYATPFEEFSILRVNGAEALAPLSGPGIAIVTEPSGTVLWDRDDEENSMEAKKGSVYFVGAGTNLGIKGEGEVWMAFYDGDAESAKEVGKQ